MKDPTWDDEEGIKQRAKVPGIYTGTSALDAARRIAQYVPKQQHPAAESSAYEKVLSVARQELEAVIKERDEARRERDKALKILTMLPGKCSHCGFEFVASDETGGRRE